MILEPRFIPEPSLFRSSPPSPSPRPHTAHRWFQQWGWGTCESVRAWIFSKYASSGIILSVKFHWNACNPPFFNLTSYVWWGCKTVPNVLGKFFFFLLPGNRIEVSISLTTASSEFLPLPFWTLSALYFANLHSILCWLSPDQKTTSYSVIHSNSIFCSHDCECNSRPTYAYFKKILTNLANITSVLLAAWSTLRSFDITAFPLSWASSSSWAGLSPP